MKKTFIIFALIVSNILASAAGIWTNAKWFYQNHDWLSNICVSFRKKLDIVEVPTNVTVQIVVNSKFGFG